jgi:hypothetical protein
MLKQHKNAFLEVIQKSGLDPELFSAEEQTGKEADLSIVKLFGGGKYTQTALVIVLRDTPLKFIVGCASHSFYLFVRKYTAFAPGFPVISSYGTETAEKTLEAFDIWLDKVVKEYIKDNEAPDNWANLEMYSSFFSGSNDPTEEPTEFTEAEKETVRQSINRFRRLVTETFKPSKEKEEFINERLDYLVKAVDRLSRFDWRGVAFSTIVSIAVNLSVDTEKGRVLYGLLQQAFQSALHLLK